jgi:hypothetical protein
MIKTLGIILGGVFVGAVGMEIVRRKCPEALDKLYTRTREMASGAKEAFKKGYESATGSKQAAEPSAEFGLGESLA